MSAVPAGTRVTRYTKACACYSTASTGRVRFEEDLQTAEAVSCRVVFIAGPSCDTCGIPWDLETS